MKVTYNDYPCVGLFVTFSVFPPDRDRPFIRSNQTNEEGIATCSFRAHPDSFGKWIINATTSIGEKPFAYDILTFEVTWIVNITEIETLDENFHLKNIFLNEEPLNIKLFLKNAAFSPQNVTISAVILDSAERCIINIVDTAKVFHGDNVIFLEKKLCHHGVTRRSLTYC